MDAKDACIPLIFGVWMLHTGIISITDSRNEILRWSTYRLQRVNCIVGNGQGGSHVELEGGVGSSSSVAAGYTYASRLRSHQAVPVHKLLRRMRLRSS